jgi:predicted DNA-binding transcriptional regulator AlpA
MAAAGRRISRSKAPAEFSSGTGSRHLRGMLTIPEVCEELQISRSTFYDWRAKRTAPRCVKLPNGALRVRRTDLDCWLDMREDAA